MKFIEKGCAGLMIALIFAVTAPAVAGSLKNLEVARAEVIRTILDPALSPIKRLRLLRTAEHKLAQLELIAIRDPDMARHNTENARLALKNYDLTFLVHSRIENGTALTDHWLNQLGITSDAIMNSSVGWQ